MQARRFSPSDVAAAASDELAGAVLLAPVRLPDGQLRKGTYLDPEALSRLLTAARAGTLSDAVRLAHLEPGDLHEDVAAKRLADAVAGPGLRQETPRQSRLDLMKQRYGVSMTKYNVDVVRHCPVVVLSVKPQGEDVVVALAPAGFTDVVKDAHISIDQSLDLSQVIVQQIPGQRDQLCCAALRSRR